jgi:integrase
VAYKTFRSTHNTTLKRVQKNHGIELMPNGGKLTSKVMRHTFATLAKFQAIDVDIIREIMGHERNEIDTVYKDKYPVKVRDAAQLKVISV